MKALLGIGACLAVSLCGIARPVKAQYTQYTYTTLDYPSANGTEANNIGPTGTIVGDYTTNGGATVHAFVLSGGVYTSFDVPGNIGYSSANGINASGQIVGIYYGGVGGVARAYIRNGSTYSEIVPPYAGSSFTQALSINDAGQAVGSYKDATQTVRGFLYNGSTSTPLMAPGATNTVAIGINNANFVVGTYVGGGVNHGFLLSGSSYLPFDAPGAAATIFEGINDLGQIAGFYQEAGGAYRSFVLDGTTLTPIDVPGATLTQAYAINNTRQVVGYCEDASGYHGFLATPHPVVTGDVNYDGVVDIFDVNVVSAHWGESGPAGDANNDQMVNIFDVNAISGNWAAIYGGGGSAATTAVPEPATLMLMLVGLLGFIAARRQLG